MRRVVLAIPNWVGDSGQEDLLRQKMEGLSRLTEMGRVVRLAPDPPASTPESLVLGLNPSVVDLRQGPLTIAALGADPPERSTHFHLSLLEFAEGFVRGSNLIPEPADLKVLLIAAKRLNTRTLTLVNGEARDHGLVWEGRGDQETTPAREAIDKPFKGSLPQGDAEPMFRRYIDDSINLLSDLELNRIRLEEGLPQFNLLWPWGQGVRTRVPNLAIRRGEPSLVISPSIRMQGLARLAGYRHEDRQNFREGINVSLELLRERIFSNNSVIAYLPLFEGLKRDDQLEEAAWFTRRLDDELFAPFADKVLDDPLRFTLVSPSRTSVGLGLQLDSRAINTNSVPFDSRPLDDIRIPLYSSWELISDNLEV